MSDSRSESESTLRGVLDAWARGIGAREPAAVAEQFTPDALFQGFDPQPGVGRAAVAAYYAKQPSGLTAEYELLSVREPAEGVIVGYARVLFRRPDGDAPTYLTVVAERFGARWLLSHYHVSKTTAQRAGEEQK